MNVEERFESAILSTAYLPNLQYLSKFILFNRIYVEHFENYQKQSFRNRCVIYGANGPLTLVIPVKKNHGEKTMIKDIQIDYELSWQRQHWVSIHSAYKNSPYFDYYMDDLCPFYLKREKYLIDLNENYSVKLENWQELIPNTLKPKVIIHQGNLITEQA
ncbi:MAG: WbqC family protein [Bacteroidales bacterium]|nr:WbqC family protein [Bacteroidales bacterium]